jgi:adenosylcobinamide kinase / adenosylcobinamide-phosphate guanylyltransferase
MRALITGGARSGKSAFAEAYAAHLGNKGFYIATAQLFDEEMKERAALHRRQRRESGFSWTTLEEPYGLSELLKDLSGNGEIVLVDCLTLWLSNWMLKLNEGMPAEPVERKIAELAETVRNFQGTLLLVTNEVGGGLVPEYPMGRRYRDLAGNMNRSIADVCERLYLVTAGVPVELKSIAFRFGENDNGHGRGM